MTLTDYQTPDRMALKRKAIPLPNLSGKSILDVGCDHGYWCRLASELGASKVLGLDRGRMVVGKFTDFSKTFPFCEKIDLGKQWHEFGKFDVVFCFSMYHHIYENCGDHNAVWFWLRRHTKEILLWENPTGNDDPVVRLNVSLPYLKSEIEQAASRYFDVEHIGPALHVKTREVWRCRPKRFVRSFKAEMRAGSSGAVKAFEHAHGRRIAEIENILGVKCVPGSLNLKCDFDWKDYYRAQILDPVERATLGGEWKPRWARFYPLSANGHKVFAFRFEGETYKDDMVELIADRQLRDVLPEAFTLV